MAVVAESRKQYVARKQREHEDYRRRIEAEEAAQPRVGWPTRSEVAKRLAGEAGSIAGLATGVPRGAFHAGQDAFAGLNFVSRLFDPTDAESSPKGQAAWDDVFRAGKGALDYVANRSSNPHKILSDLNRTGVGSNVYLHAKPALLAPTPAGEFRNQFNTGMNVGEGLFNVAGLIGAAAELRSIPELRALSKGRAAIPDLPPGTPDRVVNYMATPDPKTMGSHAPLPRATKLPGGRPIPAIISESVFNRKLPPPGTPRGVFYQYHYAIDPKYHGGPVKAAFGGGGWSGKKLGWTKYGPAARAWYGTPWQTKAAALGTLGGLGWPIDSFGPDDGQR
ncbi:hypothetical protein LJR225_003679 [Phenylobacterium sp. LjRoot225]|uniref:hypothetical protein n=1 Tax=Phenylobacterium sp. LjRoot225 TaxID=3342285 RepID=UPI003ECFEC21